jgi:hypothetical protein
MFSNNLLCKGVSKRRYSGAVLAWSILVVGHLEALFSSSAAHSESVTTVRFSLPTSICTGSYSKKFIYTATDSLLTRASSNKLTWE